MPEDEYRPPSRPDDVSTLRHYLNAVWRRKWILVAAVVLIPLATLVLSLRQSALYEASADVLVNRQEVATTSLIGQTPALDDAERTLETQARLARVPVIARRTLAAAGEGLPSGYDLASHSSVLPLADLLRFTVSDGDAARAERLAGAYAREFVRYRRKLDTAGLVRTLEELRSQMSSLEAAGGFSSPLYLRLADREQQLESLRVLRSSNVSVVRVAEPGDAERVAPRPRRDTAVALAAGLVIGLLLVFLWESLTTKPRDEREMEALLGMPFLGRLTLGSRRASLSSVGPDGAELDEVHTLRTNLELAEPAAGIRTIMVTSPRWGEGKSETLLELASALSRSGRQVAVVDLDLRQSQLTALLGVGDRGGVAAIARGERALEDAVVRVSAEVSAPESSAAADGRSERDAGPALDVLGAGSSGDAHPTELLGSDVLATALEELRNQAEFVFVDVPPLLEAPDAAALSSRMDGLLLVVGAERARTPMLVEVYRTLGSWPIAKLGFAITAGGSRSASQGRVAPAAVAVESRSQPERVG